MRTFKIIDLIRQFKKYNYTKADLEKLTKNQVKFFSSKIEESEQDTMEVVELIVKDTNDLEEQLQGWIQYNEEVGDMGDILDILNEPVEPTTEVKEEVKEELVEPKKTRGRPKGSLKDKSVEVEERNLEDVLDEVAKSISAKFNTVELPVLSPGDKLETLKKDWIQGLINSKVTFKEFQSFVEDFKETVSELYFENAVLEEVK